MGNSRPYYYVAEDNLEVVDDTSQMLVDHWNIPRYFLGWHSESRRFRLPHALKYCFPSGFHSFPTIYPYESVQSSWRNKNELNSNTFQAIEELTHTVGNEEADNIELMKVRIIDKEIESYENIDRFLLENYHMIKGEFSLARKEYVRGNCGIISILLMFLRYAPTKHSSLGVENFLWQFWMSHDNPIVNSCMRSGYTALKGGNNELASKYFQFVIDNLDSSYAEAHNKLAAAKFALRDYEGCLTAANEALSLFPNHFGALAGLGLSLEQIKKDQPLHYDAKAAYKKVLDCHPWAQSISTVLQFPKKTSTVDSSVNSSV